jgi:glycosyltransferase involved in cell wall biosynthesis
MKSVYKISIIITARNNASYISETIDSCLNQTILPLEIIYSDDFSTDNSLKIVNKYSKDIIILRHNRHVGVVQARNDGAILSKGNVLVFVDGDDILTPTFLENHLEVFDDTTPFVYAAAQAFGLFNTFWKVQAWDTLFLWNQNFVNTSAMISKEAFIKVGMWQETTIKTMWDFHLALRLSKIGKPRKSSAVLQYRQHEQSWSMAHEKRANSIDHKTMAVSIRKEIIEITIGLIYSGRIPKFISKWLLQLIEDIKILNNLPQLIIINNSKESLDFIKKDYKVYFGDIKIITGEPQIEFKTETERRNKVCELLSDQYNRIIENSIGEIIHLREDDIIPDKGSFELIYNELLNHLPLKQVVAGIYLNRNPKYKRIVGGFYNDINPKDTLDLLNAPSIEPFIVDYTGTGFLMFWKNLCPTFSPYIDNIQAHDWAWGKKLKLQGGKLWLIPKATCKHYITEKDFVEYNPTLEINPINTFSKSKNVVILNNTCTVIKSKQYV